MLPWPWFREINVCIEEKIEKFWNFSLKIIFLGVISCGESIARIPEAWKGFSVPDSGKLVHVGFSLQYTHLFPWIRVKEAFSRFGNARNRFFAWFYPYIGCFGKKNFFQRSHNYYPLPFNNFCVTSDTARYKGLTIRVCLSLGLSPWLGLVFDLSTSFFLSSLALF